MNLKIPLLRSWALAWLSIVLLIFCLPAGATTNTTTVATITITNSPTGTNGELLTIYFNGDTNGYPYTWTNLAVIGFHQLAATNGTAQNATNLYTKLYSDWSGFLLVTYAASNAVKLQTYTKGLLTATISTNWGTLAIVTNGLGSNVVLSVSNLAAQSITLGGSTITSWASVSSGTGLMMTNSSVATSISKIGPYTQPGISGISFYGTNGTPGVITDWMDLLSGGLTLNFGSFNGSGAGLTSIPQSAIIGLGNAAGGNTNTIKVFAATNADSAATAYSLAAMSVEGYTTIYATNYGVTGYMTINGLTPQLTPQDNQISNLLAAAARVGKPCIILPSGVIGISNSAIELNLFNFMLCGAGIFHCDGWNGSSFPNSAVSNNYTIIWQMNKNLDGIHINNASGSRKILLDFEVCGNTNATDSLTTMATVPIWSSQNSTNSASPFAKVGITIRTTNSSPFCGGVDMDNVVVSGFRLGMVNNGNDQIWNQLQLLADDLGLWNAGMSGFAYLDTADTDTGFPLHLNAYGRLIDTNSFGWSASYYALGAPDQMTINNLSICDRKGGVGMFLELGRGFSIRNSCGISGPNTYAVIADSVNLTVYGGNDEPNNYMGTNWILVVNGGPSIKADNWHIQGTFPNVYGAGSANLSFVSAPTSFNPLGMVSVQLSGVTFPNNSTTYAGAYPMWVGGGLHMPTHFSDNPGVWTESYPFISSIQDFGTGNNLAERWLQGNTGGYPPYANYGLFIQNAGKPLLVKSGSSLIADMLQFESMPDLTGTNVFRQQILTTDQEEVGNNWTNSAGVPIRNLTGMKTVTATNLNSVGTSSIPTNTAALGTMVFTPITAIGQLYTTPSQRGILAVSVICTNNAVAVLSNCTTHFPRFFGGNTSLGTNWGGWPAVITSPGDIYCVTSATPAQVLVLSNAWQNF